MAFPDDLDAQELDPRDVASEIAEVIIINYPHIQLSIDVEQAVLQAVNVLGGWRTYQISCTPGYGGSVLVDVEDFHKHLLPPTLTPVELEYQVKSLDEIERIVVEKMRFLAG